MSTKPSEAAPVLMIGIDAGEITLIERWMSEGWLPNLSSLRARGVFTRLDSTARWLVGSPWPSFYTGTSPAEHGMYHYLIWRPERMAHERPTREWMPLEPFWRQLGPAGRRVIAVDVPLAYAPEQFDGIEISGWATHEILELPASHPPELMRWVRDRFGLAPFDNEESHLLPVRRLLEIRDQCVRTTQLVGELGVELMRKEPWDLFMLCFAATHRGGHQLWDRTNMCGEAGTQEKQALATALRDVYVACDTAIGRLMAQAGADITTIVFSLHGMGANVSRADVLREMLARVLTGERRSDERVVRPRLSDRLRALLPIELRSWIKNRLPMALQDRLTLFWRSGGIDWHSTRAFAAFCDLDGYVRINLRGRETRGIVEPGAEYEALCSEIIAGLCSFVDQDTGEPVVDEIARVNELYPTGRMRAHLPDLMIRWSPRPAAEHRRIVSTRYGSLAWPTPGYHPQGRSGNHWPDGFLFAAGPRLPPGTTIERAHILDLAPTVYEFLGVPVPKTMQGHSLAQDLMRTNVIH
jgi:predicted AlkP superfamily phosphohydrolase/phosphomutase